jgi:hypothetical protein
MARLTSLRDGSSVLLATDTRIGRAPGNDLLIPDGHVSSLHANLQWRGHGWLINDLGSTNGTFVDGRRLQDRERCPLQRGNRIGFGQVQPGWELTDDAEPRPFATNLETGQQVEMDGDGGIVLPGPTPCVIYEDLEQGWSVETGGVTTRLRADGLVLSGPGWKISLPPPGPRESTMHGTLFTLATVHLRLLVSRDQERVTVELQQGGPAKRIPPKEPFVLLWLLAKARLEDKGGAEHDRGWADIEELVDFTGKAHRVVDEYVRRIGRYLTAAGIAEGTSIIEVNPGRRRLRIPPERLTIVDGYSE